jgi:hypothetical protein
VQVLAASNVALLAVLFSKLFFSDSVRLLRSVLKASWVLLTRLLFAKSVAFAAF